VCSGCPATGPPIRSLINAVGYPMLKDRLYVCVVSLSVEFFFLPLYGGILAGSGFVSGRFKLVAVAGVIG